MRFNAYLAHFSRHHSVYTVRHWLRLFLIPSSCIPTCSKCFRNSEDLTTCSVMCAVRRQPERALPGSWDASHVGQAATRRRSGQSKLNFRVLFIKSPFKSSTMGNTQCPTPSPHRAVSTPRSHRSNIQIIYTANGYIVVIINVVKPGTPGPTAPRPIHSNFSSLVPVSRSDPPHCLAARVRLLVFAQR
jgi:hypothetical protein